MKRSGLVIDGPAKGTIVRADTNQPYLYLKADGDGGDTLFTQVPYYWHIATVGFAAYGVWSTTWNHNCVNRDDCALALASASEAKKSHVGSVVQTLMNAIDLDQAWYDACERVERGEVGSSEG